MEEAEGDFDQQIDHWIAARVLGECGAGADLPVDLSETMEGWSAEEMAC